ncbi:MAG: DUF1593 domain-containing protein [Saprospiraceae bacterium]|nr:DUF1593 domain-containing protein [Saprospiraceae bacterium]
MKGLYIILGITLLSTCLLIAQPEERSRVFVLTDISNEPDDEESLVRFLVYANAYDVEGLVATTSTWLRERPREDLIRRQIYAYGLVRNNLERHQSGFPSKEALLATVATGQDTYGMAAVGDDKSTIGSKMLEKAIDKNEGRPLWVSIWGGANTLAQTLWDVRKERSEEELKQFVSKMKVYTISDQDDAGPWIRKEFPEVFYIVSPSTPDWQEYYRATWTGISGDRHYKNGPYYAFDLVDNPWLEENIMSHGPLGNLYPPLAYIMEGDTPSFLGLINNGLGWSQNPAYGGWAGRYDLFQAYGESRPIWTTTQQSRDCVTLADQSSHCSEQATIWRWRRDFQHDFAARMDWCVETEYENANHNPIAVLNGDQTKQIISIESVKNQAIKLSALGSSDPDGDQVTMIWFIYQEAGAEGIKAHLDTNSGKEVLLQVASDCGPGEIHVILQIEDAGTPPLVSYRRAVINVKE